MVAGLSISPASTAEKRTSCWCAFFFITAPTIESRHTSRACLFYIVSTPGKSASCFSLFLPRPSVGETYRVGAFTKFLQRPLKNAHRVGVRFSFFGPDHRQVAYIAMVPWSIQIFSVVVIEMSGWSTFQSLPILFIQKCLHERVRIVYNAIAAHFIVTFYGAHVACFLASSFLSPINDIFGNLFDKLFVKQLKQSFICSIAG